MGKPDFCPYDGKKINFDNLAYEIVHPSGWSWQRTKEETVIGSKPRIYIREEPDNRVIVLANSKKDGKCGLKFLEHFLDSGKDADEYQNNSYESRLQEMYPIRIEPPYQAWASEKTDDFQKKHPKRLHVIRQNTILVFLDESEDPVMYALPCCPYCHKRLPVGWEDADDFIGLSLRGPSGSGKTTLLYTLAYDYAAVIGETLYKDGKRLQISAACYPDYGKETEAGYLEKKASAMCRESGQCPPSGVAPPLFLEAVLEEKTSRKRLIIGIYDTPSQIPAGPMSVPRDRSVPGELPEQLEEQLYSDLFLFDPRELSGLKIGRRSISGGARFVNCKMLTPDEQARQQREKKGQVIKASELLLARGQTVQMVKNEVQKTMELYRRLLRYRTGEMRDHMKQMHFVGILTKCDLLEDHSSDVIELLGKNHCLKETDIRLPETDYGLGAAWYSISALGCDAFDNDHLLGDYAPIRAGEPVLSCVHNRMRENGWL